MKMLQVLFREVVFVLLYVSLRFRRDNTYHMSGLRCSIQKIPVTNRSTLNPIRINEVQYSATALITTALKAERDCNQPAIAERNIPPPLSTGRGMVRISSRPRADLPLFCSAEADQVH